MCFAGGAESDMELDLLGDSESDSDESTHSHTDNASIQRSAITAATAGSDAGMNGVAHCCCQS
jgi:E3 ubiquitin-protein ligase EDD1